MAKHARLSASSAYRWMACPGSVRESAGMPNRTSYAAAEGTMAHVIAADILNHGTDGKEYLGTEFSVDGHNVTPSQEMLDAVRVYTDEVMKEEGGINIEYDLTPWLSDLDPDFGGTADCIVHNGLDRVLKVFDYKHGAGVMVQAEDNIQAQYYALGASLAFGTQDFDEVEVVIVQPRGYEAQVKRWNFSSVDLLELEVDLLEGAARTRVPNPKLVPGEHCRFCPALSKPCAAVAAAEKQLVELTDAPLTDPQKISTALNLCSLLEKRIKAIRDGAFETLKAGGEVPGWKLVEKRAQRRWRDKQDAEWVLRVKAAIAPKDIINSELKSVAQIEKLTGKDVFAKLTEEHDLVVKQSSGVTLAPESDKRPAAITFDKSDFTEVPE